MKNIFLTSQFSVVVDQFAAMLPTCDMKVAFIPTAGDMYKTKLWMDADREALVNLGMKVVDFNIRDKTEEEVYSFLKAKDIIFVAGGNTFYLLYHARKSGFDKVIKKLVAEGKIYVGSSAGSCLAGPTIEPIKVFDDPAEAPELTSYEGLGLVDFLVLPHYGYAKYEGKYQSVVNEWEGKVTLKLLRDDEAIWV